MGGIDRSGGRLENPALGEEREVAVALRAVPGCRAESVYVPVYVGECACHRVLLAARPEPDLT